MGILQEFGLLTGCEIVKVILLRVVGKSFDAVIDVQLLTTRRRQRFQPDMDLILDGEGFSGSKIAKNRREPFAVLVHSGRKGGACPAGTGSNKVQERAIHIIHVG